MPFEVWQSRMYYSSHQVCCCIFVLIGLLATGVTQEVHASLLGTMVIAAVMAVILHTAHSATDQVLAHRIVEYSTFALLAIRLIAGHRTISKGSFEPLEMCLQAYGWDILRPVALAVLASTVPIRPLFMVILFFMYAVRLSITIAALTAANNLDSIEESFTPVWSVYFKSMLPLNVFAMSVLAYGMSIRQSRSVYTHMAQLQQALRQEKLANERAIRYEQRAHEAEKQVYEDSLQLRNRRAAPLLRPSCSCCMKLCGACRNAGMTPFNITSLVCFKRAHLLLVSTTTHCKQLLAYSADFTMSFQA
eukprot:6212305-Pleurochrysis_carterae.AAC.2